MSDPPLRLESDLAIVTSYFNPCGYLNRQRNFLRFARALERQRIRPWVIEVTVPGQKRFLPVSDRTGHVPCDEHAAWIWQKERLINLAVSQLPDRFTKVAWVDCDLLFPQENWYQLATENLNSWSVIQLFEQVHWLGPNDKPMRWNGESTSSLSLASQVQKGSENSRRFHRSAPGFAWAARRSVLEECPLYDREILGGGDAAFALGLYGWQDHPFLTGGSKLMREACIQYIRRLHGHIAGSVSYIPSPILHLWHGSLENRGYVQRRQKLAELEFAPYRDVELDNKKRLLRWSPNASSQLKKLASTYFQSRKEDIAEQG